MKKIFLLAAFGVAGLVSAKNALEIKAEFSKEKNNVEIKESKKSGKIVIQQCQNYGMYIPCTDETLSDSVCWGEGTGNATYEDARQCMLRNAKLALKFFCDSTD